jgi:hypothetical protein
VHSKVDDQLGMRADGSFVYVTGPILKWDADEVSATFAVLVTQKQPDGTFVRAIGASKGWWKPPSDTAETQEWAADAVVIGTGRFTEGEAKAYGIASVKHADDTYEPYPWPNTVKLQVVVAAGPVR